MLLLSNKIDRKNFFYFDPIKVNTPEQFVPLFLAQESSLAYEDYHYDLNINVPMGKGREIGHDEEFTRSVLLEQLNHPYPNEYRLGISLHPGHSWSEYSEYDVCTLVAGDVADVALVKFSNAVAKLGFMAEFNLPTTWKVVKVSPLYEQTIHTQINPFYLNPALLVVIKAKHIPYLRARLVLHLPITLPLGDMKLLYRRNIGMLNELILKEFIKTHNPIVEDCSDSLGNMLEYLHPPIKNKGKEKFIADAIAIAKETLVEI